MVASIDLLAAARAHAHHHRHPVSFGRRRFLGLAATGATVLAAGPLAGRALGHPTRRNPRPINGGVGPFHVYPVQYKAGVPEGGPPEVWDQSTITDFKGKFASTDVFGWGQDGTGRELWFRCDMRVMKGHYVGTDDEVHHGTFGFI